MCSSINTNISSLFCIWSSSLLDKAISKLNSFFKFKYTKYAGMSPDSDKPIIKLLPFKLFSVKWFRDIPHRCSGRLRKSKTCSSLQYLPEPPISNRL